MNRIITASIIILVLVSVSETHAAEWRIEPVLKVAGETDDNADLSILTDQERDISGFIGEAAARFGYSSDLTEFYAEPKIRSRQYGEEDFDTNDEFLKFLFDRNSGSSRFRLRGSYSSELARTAERSDVEDLDVEDPDAAPADDSGRVFLNGDRQRWELSPEFTYRVSQKMSVGVNFSYRSVEYDDDLAGVLNDYSDSRANLNFKRKWSEKNTALFTLTARNYDADCFTCESDVKGYGVNGGFENRLSETTTLRAVVGIEDTDLVSGSSGAAAVANLSLTRRLETITVFAQYRRAISGGGGGALLARDMINLKFNRQLNDRFTAGLGVRAYATSELEEGISSIDERDYVQLRGLVVWNLSQNLSLEAQYRYTILSRESLGESSNSNNITLGLSWRPTPIIRSR